MTVKWPENAPDDKPMWLSEFRRYLQLMDERALDCMTRPPGYAIHKAGMQLKNRAGQLREALEIDNTPALAWGLVALEIEWSRILLMLDGPTAERDGLSVYGISDSPDNYDALRAAAYRLERFQPGGPGRKRTDLTDWLKDYLRSHPLATIKHVWNTLKSTDGAEITGDTVAFRGAKPVTRKHVKNKLIELRKELRNEGITCR